MGERIRVGIRGLRVGTGVMVNGGEKGRVKVKTTGKKQMIVFYRIR